MHTSVCVHICEHVRVHTSHSTYFKLRNGPRDEDFVCVSVAKQVMREESSSRELRHFYLHSNEQHV